MMTLAGPEAATIGYNENGECNMAKRPGKKPASYQVFLSHSHQDRWIAKVLKEKIESQGVAVWLDAFDLPGGADVAERIRNGMHDSDECLILLSPASCESDWVKAEVGMAIALNLWRTVILLHVTADKVPQPIRESAPVSINDFDAYVQQLTTRMRTNSTLK